MHQNKTLPCLGLYDAAANPDIEATAVNIKNISSASAIKLKLFIAL